MFITKGAEAGGAEQKVIARPCDILAEPAGGEDADEMSAGKEQDVTGDSAEPLDDAIGASAHLGGGFAAGAAVAEEVPAGVHRQDFGDRVAVVLAVVPLDEVGVHLGDGAEASEFAGAVG